MRKNYALADAFNNFEGFLEEALMYMSLKTGNHFRTAEILM